MTNSRASEHESQQPTRLTCGRKTADRPVRCSGNQGVTTAEACAAQGMSRETLRQLLLRGVLTPGRLRCGSLADLRSRTPSNQALALAGIGRTNPTLLRKLRLLRLFRL